LAIPVLLILAVLWAAVLIPPLFKARTERRHGDSIGDFTYKLDVIGRTGGFNPSRPAPLAPVPLAGTTGAPRPRAAGVRAAGVPAAGIRAAEVRAAAAPQGTSSAQRRRRDVLVGMLVAVGVTLVAGVLTGSTIAWGAQIAVDALLVTYIVLLVRMRTLAAEQRVKVRYLPQRAPQLALRRTASS
jgi:hypothetical protein